MRRILIVGEGRHEIGEQYWQERSPDEPIPALPQLVHRLLGHPSDTSYTCVKVSDRAFRPTRGRGRLLEKRAREIIITAQEKGFAGVVIVIDRDREASSERLVPLQSARDTEPHPCAVGNAIEAFDAWMICDPNAIEAAGGDKAQHHQTPEGLNGKEGSGSHPKERATACFPAKALSDAYARVAGAVDLDHLRKQCPKGFGEFASDVEQHLTEILG